MSNGITRRNWLKLIGGSAVGLMFTPLPWKVLDDTAKWTQNWSWTPTPPRGRINFRLSTCTICPQACGIRARCVENQPVSLSGIAGHPLNDGALCPLGLGGHLLPFHPSRLLQPYKRRTDNGGRQMVPTNLNDAISEIEAAIRNSRRTNGSVAILDLRPQRTISYAYRSFLSRIENGVYIIPDQDDGLKTIGAGSDKESFVETFGVSVENARTIISFRTPVLDGWGTPSQSKRIMMNRANDSGVRTKIIQVESVRSRTAGLADEWIAVRPGTESVLALGLMNVIISERLCDRNILNRFSSNRAGSSGSGLTRLISSYTPEAASEQTGIQESRIIEIASELAASKPSVALFSGDHGGGPFGDTESTIFTNLNILLGAFDAKGVLVRNKAVPVPAEWSREAAPEKRLSKVEDHSIKLLILDGSESGYAIPWQLISRKLQPSEPIVVSLSPHLAGAASRADYLLPSPATMETYTDSPTPAGYYSSSYSITTPLLKAPEKTIHPIDLVNKLSADLGLKSGSMSGHTISELAGERAKSIYELHKGEAFDPSIGKSIGMKSIKSPEKFVDILSNGGCWTCDDRETLLKPILDACEIDEKKFGEEVTSKSSSSINSDSGVFLLPYGSRGAGNAAQSHPMMTKLFKESDLMLLGNAAVISPETGKKNRLEDGGKAIITTELGSIEVKVEFDKSVAAGVVQVAVGPRPDSFTRIDAQAESGILDICKIESDSTWKTTKAVITRS